MVEKKAYYVFGLEQNIFMVLSFHVIDDLKLCEFSWNSKILRLEMCAIFQKMTWKFGDPNSKIIKFPVWSTYKANESQSMQAIEREQA